MTARIKVTRSGEMRAVAAGLRELGPVLQKIGVLMQRKSVNAFKTQKRGSFAWPERMNPNVPGIVRDLNAGGNPKARRFVGRPALTDTGGLKQSITWDVRGDSVVIGTSRPYAKTQNEGGESQITLTSEGRQKLANLLKTQRGGKRRRAKKRKKGGQDLSSQVKSFAADDKSDALLGLGWLFSKPTFTVNVRKRTFLTVTPDDRKEVVSVIEKEAEKQLKKAVKRSGRS